MENNNFEETGWLASGVIGFLSGTITGIIIGLLFAPQSGSRTRGQLQNLAQDARDSVDGLAYHAKETVENWVEKGMKVVGV